MLINPYIFEIVDPFFSNVVALLHFDGVDGSTVFTDVTGKTWAPGNANAHLDTSQFKFGISSLRDADNNGYIDTASDPDFGYSVGDFTIEFWLRPALFNLSQIIYDQRESGNQPRPCLYTSSGNGDLHYFVSGANRINAPDGSLVIGVWKHIAISRVLGTTRLFVSGAQVGADYADATDYEASRVIVGNAGDQPFNPFGYNGWIDDMRITKGIGRYVSNFTPPTAPFPDSGP